MATLQTTAVEIPSIDDWIATDSRQLSFTVTVESGPKDITEDEVEWFLTEKAYQGRADAVLSDTDAGVDVKREAVVDPEAGEFRVDVAEDALAGEWGDYHQHVVVDPLGDSRQSWRGDVTLVAE